MKTLNIPPALIATLILATSSGFAAPPTKEEFKDPAPASDKSKQSPGSEANKSGKENDIATSKEIITQIVREDTEIAVQARRFKISTVNGHVTITGRVKYEKQKEKIGIIAVNIAGQANVDNQLTVK